MEFSLLITKDMMKIKKNHLANTIIQFNAGNRNNVNPCQVKMLTVTGRKFYLGLKRMAQQLRRLAVLVEDLCPVTGTTWYLMTFCNSSRRASNTLFSPPLALCAHDT